MRFKSRWIVVFMIVLLLINTSGLLVQAAESTSPKVENTTTTEVPTVASTEEASTSDINVILDISSYTVSVGKKLKISDIKLSVVGSDDYYVVFECGQTELLFPKVGSYKEKIIVTDMTSGFSSSVVINIKVVDTTKPVITGVKNLTINEGESKDLRYPVKPTKDTIKAVDNVDGDITKYIKMSKIDINTPGTYTLSYSVADSSGNIAVKSIKVKVKKVFTKCDKTMYVCSRELNICSEREGGVVLKVLKYRDSVNVIGTLKGSSWLKVKLPDGTIGYCYKTTLEDKKPGKTYVPRIWKAGEDETPGGDNPSADDPWSDYGYYYEGYFTDRNKYYSE